MLLFQIYNVKFCKCNNYGKVNTEKVLRHTVSWCNVGLICVEYISVIENYEDFTNVGYRLWCVLLYHIYRKENINNTFLPNASCDLLKHNFSAAQT